MRKLRCVIYAVQSMEADMNFDRSIMKNDGTASARSATAGSGAIMRYRRFNGWDYSRGASLFITIVTEARQGVFGHVVEGGI